MNLSPAVQRSVLLYIFVVSGFTGLIYESIWSHYLKLFLGHAAYAQTLVLAIFMGGMALGSWLVARRSMGLRRLLVGYAIVEAVIGVCGLFFHGIFTGLSDWSFDHVIPALSAEFLVHLYKWTLGTLLILPQSILLGMTFPLISGGIIRRWPERPGEVLSLLYFTNSLGAAVGVLVSGFVLIAAVGLPGTIATAGILNLLLAAFVWYLVRGHEEPAPAVQPAIASTGQRGPRWFVLAAFFTGAAAFLYEIGWIRMLSLVLGSSTHSFELMLSAFITGLAFGGLWIRKRIDRITDPARYLGIVMLAMGGLALLTLPAYNQTFDIMQWAMHTFAPTESGYTGFNLVSHIIALVIMLPATFCAGMTLPLLTHALLKRTGGEAAIGTIYATNTLGAIVGVLLAVHVVMPLVGVKGIIMTGAAIHMLLGLSGLVLLAQVPSPMRLKVAGACVVALVAVGLLADLDPRRMTSGVFRTGEAFTPEGAEVLYLRDGKTATISLVGKDGSITLATNGKPDAMIHMGPGAPAADEATMILAAALPLSMHPSPERVANIGFGSGLTAHTVLGSDRVKQLDSIEIEPLIVEAARKGYFPRIHRAFEDPRSRIVIEDAKTFFASAAEQYDVIISEPSNPWVSGVATLFSKEFYERVARYLREDGYFVQWVQIYEADMQLIASVMKAIGTQFPTYAMYSTDNSNVLIIATRAPELRPVSPEIFDSPVLRQELNRIGVRTTGDLEQRWIGDQHLLAPMFESFPVVANSDYTPYVDLNAPRLRYMRANALELPTLLTLPVPLQGILAEADSGRSAVEATGNSSFFRDQFVRQSRTIVQALLEGRTEGADPAVLRDVMLLRMSSEQCRTPESRNVWRRAAREISDLTTPFVPAATLAQLWDTIRATPCYSEYEGAHRDWADLLAAIAARDAAQIEKLGDKLLADRNAHLSQEERTFVGVASAAAKLRSGASKDALKLLAAITENDDFAPFYELSLRQLIALGTVTPNTRFDPERAPVIVDRVQ